MLSLGCRRFLRRARPGLDTAHRRQCARCDQYARLLEQVARPLVVLPETLAAALKEIADTEDSLAQSPLSALSTSALLAPMDLLPRKLCSDLKAIFRPPLPPLPRFLGSPLYSVAASYVLVVLMTLVWGNPYTALQPTLSSVQTSAAEVLDQSNDLLSSWFDKVRSGFSRQGQRALHLGEQITQQVRKIESSLVLEKFKEAESKGEWP